MKYIAKRMGLSEGVEDPVPKGCCRFTYSRGLLPSRAEWALLRAWMSRRVSIPIRDLCDGTAWFTVRVDGELRLVRADARFWRKPWFQQLRDRLMEELAFEGFETDEHVYAFAAQLLAFFEAG